MTSPLALPVKRALPPGWRRAARIRGPGCRTAGAGGAGFGLAVEAQAGPGEAGGQGAFGEYRRVDEGAPVVVGVEGGEAVAVGQQLDGDRPAAHAGPVGAGFEHQAQALEGLVGVAAAQAVDAEADAGGHHAHDDQHHHDLDEGEARLQVQGARWGIQEGSQEPTSASKPSPPLMPSAPKLITSTSPLRPGMTYW
jgi:hypothetical protein